VITRIIPSPRWKRRHGARLRTAPRASPAVCPLPGLPCQHRAHAARPPASSSHQTQLAGLAVLPSY